MLPGLSTRSSRAVCVLSLHARRLATAVPVPTGSGSKPAVLPGKEGAMRPHLGIEVNPSHGLYAFFRRKEKEGEVYYDTVEPQDMIHDKGGRSWSADELRRKSFKDLHTLWYVVLRERNLLATQQAEARRMGANEQALSLWSKAFRCRKTMARIKYVINERRLAYEGAMKIHKEQLQGSLQQAAKKAVEVKAITSGRKQRKPKQRVRDAGSIAAQSIFETVPDVVGQKA